MNFTCVNDYPQKEIKRQLDDKYDIYCGLLGSRFGSPTPNAGSGTEEEFNDAIASFRNDTTSKRVFFYFKQSIENVLKVDPLQLQKVQEFQQKLPQLGVLYKEYTDKEHFLEIVFHDLLKLIADDWVEDKWKIIKLERSDIEKPEVTIKNEIDNNVKMIDTTIKNIQNTEDEYDDDEEIFILDSLKELNESNEIMMKTTELLNEGTKELGENMEKYTNELNMILARISATSNIGGSRQNQLVVSKASEIVDKIAAGLENYAQILSPYTANFQTEIDTFLNCYSKIYKYTLSQPHQDNEDLESAFDTLESMLREMIGAKNSMMDLQETIEAIPALTRRFKRARNNSSITLSNIINALDSAVKTGQKILSEMDDLS